MNLRRERGFTLIEVLVVAVIAATVMSLASAGLHSVLAASAFARTKSGLVHMDARGRMHARASGEAVLLEFDIDRGKARLMGERSRMQLAQVDVPSDVGVTIRRSQPGEFIRFDRRGTSVDYVLELRSATRAVRLTVAGLTGEVEESEATR